MKKLFGTDSSHSYTFTPDGAGLGRIVLTGVALVTNEVLLINNATAGTIIGNPFNVDTTFTAVPNTKNNTTVITLNIDTSSMSSGDSLQIFYDDSTQQETVLNEMSMAFRNLYNNITRPSYAANGGLIISNFQSAAALPTVITVNTVATVSNITQLGGNDVRNVLSDPLSEITFGQNIRTLIS